MNVKNKNVTVLGLGKSGFESALFLAKNGAKVLASESKPASAFPNVHADLKTLGIDVEFGKHSMDRILKSDFIVISPGISPKTEIYQAIKAKNVPMMSEIELAFRFCPCPVVAVTGTNGKTTVTTLIHKLISENGIHAISCGNIGNPFIGEVSKLTPKSFAVIEVSSFQLENVETFKPHVAVLTNLTDNHYDWHGTFKAYADAKFNLFKNQTRDDFAVLSESDAETKRRAATIPSQKIFFNSKMTGNPNFDAVLTVAHILNLNEETCRATLKNFKGIEHRMEELPSKDGFTYINDSKSTTIASLGWALERTNEKVVLIMGGLHKGGDFGQIKDKVSKKVKSLVLIGKASDEIEIAFKSVVPVQKAKTLEEAISFARKEAKAGDKILFSPACASFDMFKDYQDRGRQFKSIVSNLQKVAAHV